MTPSCRHAAKVLQAYLDGEVDAVAADRVEDHLEMCRRCGLEADAYREIKASLSRTHGAVPELALHRLREFGDQLVAEHPGGRRRGQAGSTS